MNRHSVTTEKIHVTGRRGTRKTILSTKGRYFSYLMTNLTTQMQENGQNPIDRYREIP